MTNVGTDRECVKVPCHTEEDLASLMGKTNERIPMRKIAFLAVIVLLTAPFLAAQEHPSPPPDHVLKILLDLDDSQFAQLHVLLEARNTALTDLTRRVQELQGRLEQALNQSTPDPASVGALLISIRGTEHQAAQQQESFRNAFLTMLSEEQRHRVEAMKFVRAALYGGEVLERLGL